ncbi:MAG TPA: gephyrin-like molybdotransferase Glp [Candidatus Acidoferrales bacterium]|jgi:molybdopterin molybdotransferase|nr:gephyrin-like molybdotransferase Glp [Candidatus Acidoferrales bacterium]
MISFEAARAKVIEVLAARVCAPERETVDLSVAPAAPLGRILAENIVADRNYPPFNRSIRDGFALRSADAAGPGAKLRLIAESRAGVAFHGTVGAGECVRILTGAPVPRGANAVVMHEFTREEGDFVVFEQAARAGQYYVLAGAEARVGEVVVPRGTRIGYAELGRAAEVGHFRMEVSRRPRVAILSTGDELVPVDRPPGPFQIRNSNNISLAAQVALAGGEPLAAGSAKDEVADLRARIEKGLEADLLLLSGGVSVGKYDLVEQVLKDLGAEFFFDAVAIRPGKPVVFGWCRGKPVFGLPGNPVSTMVTFELFVVPAIDALSGAAPQPLPLFKAKLAHPVDEKGGVAHILPARASWPKGEQDSVPKVEVLLWEGSGDIGAVVRGNCYLVVHASRLHLQAGEWVDVLPRRGTY